MRRRALLRRLGVCASAALLPGLAGCGLPGTFGPGQPLRPAVAAPPAVALPPLTFPGDEAPHDNLTEWWYYTGHLAGAQAAGRSYGFELTFFQTLRGQLPPWYAAHFAVTDLTRGSFQYDERVAFGRPARGDPNRGFDLTLGGWSIRGSGGRDALAARLDNASGAPPASSSAPVAGSIPPTAIPAGPAEYAIDLTLVDGLPAPIPHGSTGLIGYGDAGFSYYYSRPRMGVAGTLVDHGESVPVTGLAWMDHQWGNFITLAGSGWDWISLQLEDGSAWMVYVIRDSAHQPLSVVATAVDPNGQSEDLPAAAVDLGPTGEWRSSRTGGTYPSGWQLQIPSRGLSLTIAPLLKDQELVTTRSTGIAYWEGTVDVQGTRNGRSIAGQGYVELTGYAQAV